MTSDLQLAFELLLLGMLTVFLVLALVVLTARILILAVNKWSSQSLRSRSSEAVPLAREPQIKPEIIAALSAAVEAATNGRGRLLSAERTDA